MIGWSKRARITGPTPTASLSPLLHLPPQPFLSFLSLSPSYLHPPPHTITSLQLSLSYLFLPISSSLRYKPPSVELSGYDRCPQWHWAAVAPAPTRHDVALGGSGRRPRRRWVQRRRSGRRDGTYSLSRPRPSRGGLCGAAARAQSAARTTVAARESRAAAGAARLTAAARCASSWVRGMG